MHWVELMLPTENVHCSYAVNSPSWQSQRWPPVPLALRWKTNSPKRRPTVSQVTASPKTQNGMWLYSRSTTVIHHDSPWLIRHDTLSVRVRQSSGNRSGSGINVCTPMLSVVNPGSSWYGTITPCSNIPVKTLGRPRITKEIRTKVTTRFQSFPHQWHRSKNRQYPDM